MTSTMAELGAQRIRVAALIGWVPDLADGLSALFGETFHVRQPYDFFGTRRLNGEQCFSSLSLYSDERWLLLELDISTEKSEEFRKTSVSPAGILSSIAKLHREKSIIHADAHVVLAQSKYESLFPLPLSLPPALDIIGFDEIRGVRLYKKLDDNFTCNVVLDRAENEDYHMAIRAACETVINRGLPERALELVWQVVDRIAKPSTHTAIGGRGGEDAADS